VADVAGYLLLIARMTGEVVRQNFSRAPHAMNDSLGEFAPAKIDLHLVRDFLSELIAALLVNGAFADDGEFPDARSDEKQNAISFRGLLHAEMVEHLLGGGHCILRFFAADEDADLAAHFGFHVANLLDDRIVLKPV